MQNNIKAVFFDFDGTIVFLPINYRRLRRTLKTFFSPYGIKSGFIPLFKSINDSVFEIEKMNYPKSLTNKIKNEAYTLIKYEEINSIKNAKLAKFTNELFISLKKKNIKRVIFSRNTRSCIALGLSKFDLLKPDMIVSREDVKKIKPDPEHVLLPMKKLKLRPSEVVIVGDSFHDIEAGRAAGIKTILITHGRKKDKDLNPDFTINSLDEIMKIIESL